MGDRLFTQGMAQAPGIIETHGGRIIIPYP